MTQTQATQEEQKPAAAEKKEAPAVDGINTFAPGAFEVGSPEGAWVTMDIPAPGDYPELNKLLKEIHAGEDFSFILADVDNRQGTDQVSMNRIEITDPEGKAYTYQALYDYLIDVDVQASGDKYKLHDGTEISYDDYERLTAAVDDQKRSELAKFVIPKARGKMLLVGPKLPEVFTSVQVYPSSVVDAVYAAPKQP
ncbi:hypothetical protein ACUIAC_00825 [Dermabacteraceae bacterium P13138]